MRKMTVNDIYNRVLILLGEDGLREELNNDTLSKSHFLSSFNEIMSDLTDEENEYGMYSELDLPQPLRQAALYGTAMLLSLENGQTESNRIFCELYNSKRAAAKGRLKQIKNVFRQLKVTDYEVYIFKRKARKKSFYKGFFARNKSGRSV